MNAKMKGENINILSPHRLTLCAMMFVFSFLLALPLISRPASAHGGCDMCICVPIAHGTVIPFATNFNADVAGNRFNIRGNLREEHRLTTRHIVAEFDDYEAFLLDPIWSQYILPAWMMMTEQLVSTAMFQMLMLGSLFDAKQQLETQHLFQKLEAQAHQDYHPSHNMCVFGTNIRSLAEAERNYEYTTYVMSQRSIDRQMGNMNTAASRGRFDDQCFRLRQFRKRYCDLRDNNEHIEMICNPDPTNVLYEECLPDQVEVTADSKNKDIDFMRTVDSANTLEIDFYTPDPDPSEDEQDVFALASNLYSHDIMFRMPETAMMQRSAQDELLDMRSVIAKRSVAEHSFNTIVGMKAMSNEDATLKTQPYMRLILESLGIGDGGTFPNEEIEMYLGDRPSYYAQMELLTKKVFQTPDFFVNLYDEPANVDRVGVTLQAIGLMQDFDTWQSYLRTEAMLSVVLELELLKLNNEVAELMGTIKSGGFEL